ncbi:MAG: LysE family translocator [Rhodomicrobium sp.]|nr:LysE family translocator [Rhodomicrobium sp.]
MIEMIAPIALFSFAASATPGPNNVMLTASGSAFGFQRSVPHILGITIGFPVMFFAVGLGLGEIFTRYPQVHLALKYVGAAYLLYLAWRIAQAGHSDGAKTGGRPLTFLEAAAFQWVNPKAWMIAVSAIPAFTTVGGNYYAELTLIGVIFALVTLPSCSAWCMFGVGIRRLIRTPETARLVNLALAALVALSIILLFI